MSEILTREYYGVPVWIWAIPVLGLVVGGVWLAYQYFIEPGAGILRSYEEILADIYKETKDFLEANAELDPPIYGLTASQEGIINAKEKAAEELRPLVEEVLESRGIPVFEWVETAIIGIILIYAIPHVAGKLVDILKKWRTEQTEAAVTIQSSFGHTYLVMQLIENELALTGKLNIASGFAATMQTHYAAYTSPALASGISYYSTLIPTLIEGTMAWIVATHMLTYMTYEASAATGIMGTMWTWWLPALI